MKLLVIVLCLLSERFLIHSLVYQRFNWFEDYCAYIKKVCEGNSSFANPWLALAAFVLPICLPAFLIYIILHSIFWGFLGLIFSIVVLLYSLGPQNAFYPVSDANSTLSNNNQVGAYLADVNRQLFSVIFWYLVAGPVGALTYRLITLCRNNSLVAQQAAQLTDLLEWIPARITTILYLLVGNFQRGFILFSRLFFTKPELNNQLLSDCGLQAVRTSEIDEIPLSVAENLVEHATIVLLVLMALFTLMAW